MKLVDASVAEWRDRAHFFALSARLMRRILVDAARAKRAGKRGGGAVRLEINGSIDAAPLQDDQGLRLNDALDALQKFEARLEVGPGDGAARFTCPRRIVGGL